MKQQKYMTTKEVAEYLRMTPARIYILARQKKIPFGKAEGHLLFDREVIDRWLIKPEQTLKDWFQN